MDEKIVYSGLLWYREYLFQQRKRLTEAAGYVVYSNIWESMRVSAQLECLDEDIERIDKQLEQVREFSQVVKDIGIATGETSNRVAELLRKFNEDNKEVEGS
ncbi:hypothetical protein CKN99_06035 [Carnobacterium maltaromaticum]|uniref:hypothetical protein n=1 Tax=Carnobacterium maltaromaticum TaxID=2751 RepID=UPI001071C549|nr:hypothetical protein [Carnobacterium maltaromaticum]MDT1946069.1 hypothetical protein [Carnobacterium maltaromaticum]MDT2000573.1 hypothetical protein [Carnobacterium maltaromaticum]TFJ28870.1 hypothetical protein CKN90_05990 [Carnobacterium maltaromaticum]TFJ32568.1 hypothetical protein CKN98_06000 [Carnobacterium maltaromaticum]TFJ36596.1 hypothetical protein CKN88_06060 [Carnobacterium maltaromaticum]